MRRQKKFTNLEGSAEQMGDLKSVVLHDMEIKHVKSSFPCSLGMLPLYVRLRNRRRGVTVSAQLHVQRNFFLIFCSATPCLPNEQQPPAHVMQHCHRTLLTPIVA